MTTEMTAADLKDLKRAKSLLENSTLAGKLQKALGRPIEEGMKWLPAKWHDTMQQATESALRKGLDFAVTSIGEKSVKKSSNAFHKTLVTASGIAGGAFGLPALAIELPVSTVIMLRSIADIARSEGEDISTAEAKMACLEVFALGGHGPDDDRAQTSYFAVRAVLSRQFAEAARVIAQSGTVAGKSAPAVVRFISSIASRFGIVVSEKAAASAVPVVGAAGGALINMVFMDHFQDMARGHFIVRRLERQYSSAVVRAAYEKL